VPLASPETRLLTHRSLGLRVTQSLDHSNYFQQTIGSKLFIKAA
jgi:hypothetical protein